MPRAQFPSPTTLLRQTAIIVPGYPTRARHHPETLELPGGEGRRGQGGDDSTAHTGFIERIARVLTPGEKELADKLVGLGIFVGT